MIIGNIVHADEGAKVRGYGRGQRRSEGVDRGISARNDVPRLRTLVNLT
jgi:hypothetical protein